jgi:hypothetical protein
MAGVERAERALQDILASYKSHRTAKLTVSTDKGELKVTLVDNFTLNKKRREALAASKDTVSQRGKSSLQRRREKRAADPAVRQRSAAHAAKKATAEMAAAERAAAERAAAEKAAAEKAAAEKATAAAEKAAKTAEKAAEAAPTGQVATPAGQLIPPAAAAGQAAMLASEQLELAGHTGPQVRAICKKQNLPSSGNKAALLERLAVGAPEQLRDSTDKVLAATASPVKGDGRAEQCPCCGGPAAPDHQCDVVLEEVEELPGGEPDLEECAVESPAPSPDPRKLPVKADSSTVQTPAPSPRMAAARAGALEPVLEARPPEPAKRPLMPGQAYSERGTPMWLCDMCGPASGLYMYEEAVKFHKRRDHGVDPLWNGYY